MTDPMAFTHARAFIERQYAEAGPFQWARETAMNAVEAGATKVDFGIDWNSVKASGVYRRTIADNGCGMTEDELVTFFRTIGGTSKAIGGAHENFGVGAKLSLLPWNTAGLVVASWKNGEGNVIWAKADAHSEEYGLRKVEVDDEVTDVWPTGYDPDLGFDLDLLRPDWLTHEGTVLLLLGDTLDQDTVLNDPRRDDAGPLQLSSYLSRRLWRVPDTVEITVDQLTGDDKAAWPSRPNYMAGKGSQRRRVRPGERILRTQAQEQGSVVLADSTRVHWFLRDTAVDKPPRGFLAALYRDELYEHKEHFADYRNFGIGHADVRKNLWLIVEPKLADETRRAGAFPEGDRNALLWNDGATGENRPLPWADWGAAWIDRMPEEVRAALDAQQRGGEIRDESYRKRLATLLGDRFKMERRELDEAGELTVDPSEGRRRSRRSARTRNSPRLDESDPKVGNHDGEQPATATKPSVALPEWVPCGPVDLEEGLIAAFLEKPRPGKILLNVEHPVVRDQVAHWQAHYPHEPATVRGIVHDVYGESAVAAIAHSEELKRLKVDRTTIKDKVRSPHSLTLALLGLMAHDQMISQRLASRLGKRRVAEEVALSADDAGEKP